VQREILEPPSWHYRHDISSPTTYLPDHDGIAVAGQK
jgi:hypothetical protein